MSTDDIFSIQRQKSDVFEGSCSVRLKSSCIPGEGILRLSVDDQNGLAREFENVTDTISFFIPASGSGSRMFAELVEFANQGEDSEDILNFFRKLPELALFHELPVIVKEKVQQLQPKYVAEYLVNNDGMDFTTRPKGLIPFHLAGDKVSSPFQDQLIQAYNLLGVGARVHFTIQKKYESRIMEAIRRTEIPNLNEIVSFSYQDSNSDAYCFDGSGNVIAEKGEPLRRPAGHGALLKNLNEIEEDVVLIKNIDNVQHNNKSETGAKTWKYCTVLLLKFKEELRQLTDSFSKEGLEKLNAKYQFLSEQEVTECDAMQILNYASRPTRICGMVINEGAPGGGPFWIEDENGVTKQIVEKVQIADSDKGIMNASSHFNPVFIALSKSDVHGNPLDLTRFADNSKYLTVSKPFKGQMLRYRELPGLWNGSMSNWNTVFVEIPKEAFSPVKSVIDLLGEAHQSD